MMCVMCNRVILREPAARIGGRGVGPKCAQRAGLLPTPVRRYGQTGTRKMVQVDRFTEDLFREGMNE